MLPQVPSHTQEGIGILHSLFTGTTRISLRLLLCLKAMPINWCWHGTCCYLLSELSPWSWHASVFNNSSHGFDSPCTLHNFVIICLHRCAICQPDPKKRDAKTDGETLIRKLLALLLTLVDSLCSHYYHSLPNFQLCKSRFNSLLGILTAVLWNHWKSNVLFWQFIG